jgi:hypothetical protein
MRRPRTSRGIQLTLAATAAFLAGGLAVGVPREARATEPKKASEPRIMSEPGEVTNVVDAFDEEKGDPFDVHIMLGYQYSSQSSKILRENYINQPGLSGGGFTTSLMNVAQFTESTSRLNTRIDVALYKDIGLYLRMPLILSNSRELNDLDGSSRAQSAVLAGSPKGDGSYEKLFSVPFKSPTRSGIEYLAVGFDFGIFNQARDPSKPTWVFGAEGRFTVSEPMHACGPTSGVNVPGSQVECADPSDINRNGKSDVTAPENNQALEGSASPRKPGVSRGTTALEIHSIMSRRVKYVEPYGGFRALLEFANKGSDYGQTSLDAVLTSSPPLQGWMIMGMMFHPYEHKEQFQRLTFDVRFTGAYRSEGRDYSPLFDALGSSDAPSVRRPNFSDFRAPAAGTIVNGRTVNSVANTGSQKVYVTGLTDTAAHGSLQISGSAQFQAAEFIKFQIGAGWTYIQPHNITGDQPCNPNFKNDVSKSGPCQSSSATSATTTTNSATGVPNPLYRPAIDIVGRRFVMDAASQVDVWANAVVMF